MITDLRILPIDESDAGLVEIRKALVQLKDALDSEFNFHAVWAYPMPGSTTNTKKITAILCGTDNDWDYVRTDVVWSGDPLIYAVRDILREPTHHRNSSAKPHHSLDSFLQPDGYLYRDSIRRREMSAILRFIYPQIPVVA